MCRGRSHAMKQSRICRSISQMAGKGQGILDYLLKETPEAEIEMHRYNQLPEVERLWIKMNGKISFLYEETRLELLSGGEKVKLQLLKLMMAHCTLLCLDEPSNDLDLNTIKWLENWIRQLEIPCIFISHDEWLLRKCANQILHLEQVNRQSKCRHTLFKGSYDAYRSQRQSAYAKEVQIAHNEKLAYRKQMTRMNDIANAVRSAQNQISRQQPYLAARLKSKMHTVNAQIKRIEEKAIIRWIPHRKRLLCFLIKRSRCQRINVSYLIAERSLWQIGLCWCWNSLRSMQESAS